MSLPIVLSTCTLRLSATNSIRNKKLLVTGATLAVTGALLVVTRSYSHWSLPTVPSRWASLLIHDRWLEPLFGRSNGLSRPLFQKLGELGLLGVTVPEAGR